jgi:hypothetical protein
MTAKFARAGSCVEDLTQPAKIVGGPSRGFLNRVWVRHIKGHSARDLRAHPSICAAGSNAPDGRWVSSHRPSFNGQDSIRPCFMLRS